MRGGESRRVMGGENYTGYQPSDTINIYRVEIASRNRDKRSVEGGRKMDIGHGQISTSRKKNGEDQFRQM